MKGVRVLRKRNTKQFEARNTLGSLVKDIEGHGSERRSAINDRLVVLLDALGRPAPNSTDTRALLQATFAALTPLDTRTAWLMLAVLSARLPRTSEVLAAVRNAEADGMVAAVRGAFWSGPMPRLLDAGPYRTVRVIRGRTLIDVHHTAQYAFATGIQRVAREATRRWVQEHRPTVIGWHGDLRALRELTPPEIRRACWGGPQVVEPEPGAVLIPVDCIYLVPELITEVDRTDALRCLAEFSSNRLGVIGFDMVPITVPETCDPAMPPAFARNLSAVRYATCVATISEASAVEYQGWANMLPDIGVVGPRIKACPLPNEGGGEPSDEDRERAAERLLVGLPMVLVIGSHEPRKNHLAVLHAAELLWRDGLRFSLTFIGGNAWNSDNFRSTLAGLQAAGRPIESISAATDALLWSALRLARFTVFPSINEGFGLPVVESVACGTPVITSSFGAMQEIAADGGVLTVDPRDDHALAGAMRALLTDDALLDRLRGEAARRTLRTWDSYAAEVWELLTA